MKKKLQAFKKFSKTKKTIIIVTAIVIFFITVLLIARISGKIIQQKRSSTKPVYNVNVLKARKILLTETLSVQSLVEGNPQVKVYPNSVSGLFIRNAVKEGDLVKKDMDISYIDRNIPGSDFLPAPVKSPISGMITKLYYFDRGSYITTLSPIAEVANINSVKIIVNFGEADLLKIKTGQKAHITSTYTEEIKIEAKVGAVTPFIDNETYSGYITIIIDNKEQILKIGMSVNVEVEIGERNTFFVPESTVLMGMDKTFIFLNKNGIAKLVPVKTGFSKNGNIEIIGDINEDDEIITEGNFKLYDNAEIKIFDPANRSGARDKKNGNKKK